MTFLITGAAGFIGYHTARRLLERGDAVIGIDNLNTYYSVALKRDRIAQLRDFPEFTFLQLDLADFQQLVGALSGKRVHKVIHLAAQAGVRYSIENPHAYVQSNLVGHVNLLEYCRHLDGLEVLSYASSSSVYGGNVKMPFSETDPVDTPISLYAATKKSDEVIGHAYAHLYNLPQIGFRFFTVYGPWGRPDMAMWLFAKAILAGEPISVFNHGRMKRDFTYIDDVVTGVLKATDRPEIAFGNRTKHRIYNIGNNNPEDLMQMIGLIEDAVGKKAEKRMLPLQPGDVPESWANIEAIRADYGVEPTTPISVGIPRFIEWFKQHYSHYGEA